MATIETISEALKLVDEKKENLRKAFEELQSHSSSLSSFTLTWSDIDSHFSALHSTVLHKFNLLKSQPSVPQPQIESTPSIEKEKDELELAQVTARPELKSFCESMDGSGLRNYILNHIPKERLVIGNELRDAFKYAPNAAEMVLLALEGFFIPNLKGDKDIKLLSLRKACIVMLEGLLESKVEVSPEVRERAKNLALDWREKVSIDGSSTFEPYGFLYLVAIYGLVDVFSMDYLLDMSVIATSFAQGVRLIRALCLGNKMSDLIKKIISKGKQLQAVKYALEFKLADKFPPVSLLKEYVEEAKKNALKIKKDGKHSLQSLNEATTKEVSALTSVINIINDFKLEAEPLKQSLAKRIEVLEKEKANRKKHPLPSFGPKLKPQNPTGTKRPRTTTQTHIPNTDPFASSANILAVHQSAVTNIPAVNNPAVPPFQQPYSASPNFSVPYNYNSSSAPQSFASTQSYNYVKHNTQPSASSVAPAQQQSYLQPANLLPAHYSSPEAAPYSVAPYASSSSGGLFGSAEASLGIGNSTHVNSHVYNSEPNAASAYYDGSVKYGGYSMPSQYRPSYLPQ